MDNFVYSDEHPSELYYGVSIAGWRKFFSAHDYHFVTVNWEKVNAFVDPNCFSAGFYTN